MEGVREERRTEDGFEAEPAGTSVLLADSGSGPAPPKPKAEAEESPEAHAAALRAAFQKETDEIKFGRLRIAAFLGIVLFLAFSFLDYIVAREHFRPFLGMRVGSAGIHAMVLLLSRYPWLRRNLLAMGFLTFLPISAIISLMCQFTGGYSSAYYAGLITIMVGSNMLIPWSLRDALYVTLGIYGTYLLPLGLGQPVDDWKLFVNNNYFLLCVGFLSTCAVWFSDQVRFREFMNRWETARAKESLEEAHQKLQELDLAKSQFFANISHELRTPLTLSLAPVEAMLTERLGGINTQQREYLSIVHKNALRLLKLINNLLDFSKIEAGRMKLEVQETDLGELTRELVEASSGMADGRGIVLRLHVPPDLPPIYLDRDKVEKVIVNLLSNALKFTPRGGEIDVRLREEDRTVAVSVRDTGVGIPPDYIEKVFDRFAQVDGTTKREFEGTGIGLSLARELVRLHGGDIGVESRQGEGSTFTFRLLKGDQIFQLLSSDRRRGFRRQQDLDLMTKVQKAEHQAERTDAAAGVVKLGLSELIQVADSSAQRKTSDKLADPARPTVLTVDDNPEITRLLGFILGGDYNILKAANGVEALEVLGLQRVDLVISDVMMPKMTGFELCEAVKSDARFEGLPVILLTTKTDLARKMEGFRHGADDYLSKPFHAEELKARVAALLSLRAVGEQLRAKNAELGAALSELKEAQARLVLSERLASVGRVAAGIAHEINNPINAVSNCVEPLRAAVETVRGALERYEEFARSVEAETGRKGVLDSLRRAGEVRQELEDLEMLIDMIDRGSSRTREIVAGLKTFSHLQKAEFKDLDVNEGLRSTLLLLGSELKKGPIDVQADYGDAGLIEGNAGELNQVFMNLLSNAIQAIGGRGAIKVSTRRIGGEAVIVVSDTGCGMTKEVMEKIFDPFFTTKDVGKGTGLGLSISHGIVERHGGRIEVESKVGEGTTFRVILPVRQEPAAARA